MSKDEVALSGGKTCSSKTKIYERKSKNCARKITRKFGLRVRKKCAQCLKIILD